MHHPTDRITHITADATSVVEHWLEREIAQWVHHEESIRRPIAPCANYITTGQHRRRDRDHRRQLSYRFCLYPLSCRPWRSYSLLVSLLFSLWSPQTRLTAALSLSQKTQNSASTLQHCPHCPKGWGKRSRAVYNIHVGARTAGLGMFKQIRNIRIRRSFRIIYSITQLTLVMNVLYIKCLPLDR